LSQFCFVVSCTFIPHFWKLSLFLFLLFLFNFFCFWRVW
jgi:hypothetical protein